MSTLTPFSSAFPTKPLKYLAALRGEKVDGVPTDGEYIGLEQIESGTGRLSDVELQQQPEGSANAFWPGDVLFGKLRPYLAKGWTADRPGYCTTEALVLQPTAADSRFVRYCVLASEFIEAVNGSTYGSKMPRADWSFVGTVQVPCPDRSLQERIANFLDEQTARIEALIAEKELLLQKLREQRYSYTSQLMTRGLDTSAALKRTSFQELGAIPEHWDVKRLKFLGEVRSGVAKGKDLGEVDKVSLPYLRVANVQDGFVDLSEVLEIEVAATDAGRYLLKAGDVLMNEGGDNDKLGRGTVWQGQIDPCIHQNHVFAVRLNNPEDAEWVAKFTSTDAARTYFFLRSKQSTNLASINQTNVRELPVPMPPSHERASILGELNRFTAAVDLLCAHAQEHIARLREYRSSLISAAVTGQHDLGTAGNPQTLAAISDAKAGRTSPTSLKKL